MDQLDRITTVQVGEKVSTPPYPSYPDIPPGLFATKGSYGGRLGKLKKCGLHALIGDIHRSGVSVEASVGSVGSVEASARVCTVSDRVLEEDDDFQSFTRVCAHPCSRWIQCDIAINSGFLERTGCLAMPADALSNRYVCSEGSMDGKALDRIAPAFTPYGMTYLCCKRLLVAPGGLCAENNRGIMPMMVMLTKHYPYPVRPCSPEICSPAFYDL